MVLNDDSNASDQLPGLPNLPGMSDLPGKNPDSEGVSSSSKEPSEQGNVVPDFSGNDAQDDKSVAVDLPAGRIVTATADAPPAEDENDPYLGRMFGNYELVQKVGQGGMGLVYKGRQVSLDRTVAVKILNKSLCDNEEFIKRFEREAKSIARINHPNIMAVYDFGQTGGLYYMVTEFIEGASLSKQITDRVMMTIDDFAPLLVQCLAGLAHVGTSGIVHRDIKPDNILITLDGTAKIADFGLAKDVSRNDSTDLTAVGLAMGTPAYMSPEQCMGRKLDGRSDIYALGVTAYLALTGEKPFTGQSSFEIMTKQREYTPPAPRQLNPAIPKDVSDMVMRMLAKNPQDRFKDSEDCRQAWLELGNRLGFMRIGGNSQESGRGSGPIPPPDPAKARTGAIVAPQPAIPSALPAPLPPPPSITSPLPEPPGSRPVGPEQRRTRVSGEYAAPTSPDAELGVPGGTDRQGRTSTDRKTASQRSMTASDGVTCEKCGMLNRGDAITCSRCNNPLRDFGSDPDAVRTQEAEAQRMYNNGQFKEAATLYARLADREQDRRARAILRSKERDARTQDNQKELHEIKSRTKGLLERGDLKGSIDVLERGLASVREAGASSSGAESKLVEDINALRARLRHRRNAKILIIVLILSVLAIVALIVLSPQIQEMLNGDTSSETSGP